jgi:hypothetical protein
MPTPRTQGGAPTLRGSAPTTPQAHPACADVDESHAAPDDPPPEELPAFGVPDELPTNVPLELLPLGPLPEPLVDVPPLLEVLAIDPLLDDDPLADPPLVDPLPDEPPDELPELLVDTLPEELLLPPPSVHDGEASKPGSAICTYMSMKAFSVSVRW